MTDASAPPRGSTPTEWPRWRLLLLVSLLGAATYGNALGNGWTFDDQHIVASNPVVTEPRWGEALTAPYWTELEAPPTLYRPTTVGALALQWQLFGDRPAAFHAVNLLLHVLAGVLVTLLLATLLPPLAAAAGGALFAVHPVHVEAVANVVGQSELLAATAYLGACLAYLKGRGAGPGARALRLLMIAALYGLALGAKESAVTLPLALLLLELALPPERSAGGTPSGPRALPAALRREAPLYLLLGALLLTYLGARLIILGSVRGEVVSPELVGLPVGARVLTAISLWPHYLRLLAFPLDFAADYGPGVLMPATGLRPDVVLGGLLLAGLSALALRGWRAAPWAALAAAWLIVTVLPVSNLIVPAGTLLAERTLYLPSVALALAGAGALHVFLNRRPERLRPAWGLVAVIVGLFLVRSVLRNPTWLDSYTVMNTLALEHPESWRSHRARAAGLVQVGDVEGALGTYERALALLPNDYTLLCEAGSLYKRQRDLARAETLLVAAVDAAPGRPIAYRLLAELYLLAGDGRQAHATALAGLARWGSDRELWALVSESYVAKGDLAAAIRAREAALGADPGSHTDRARLSELRAVAAERPPAGDAG